MILLGIITVTSWNSDDDSGHLDCSCTAETQFPGEHFCWPKRTKLESAFVVSQDISGIFPKHVQKA